MLSDLVDIVDEHDQVIGTVSIQKAREKGSIHRIARVMVESNSGKKILLQKRTAKLLWPHCWDNSAAGHVDAGEDYLTAAKRELFEEIGIATENLEEIGKYSTDQRHQGYDLRRFNMVYRYKTDNTPTKLQKDEVSEVCWFSLEEVKKLIQEHSDQVTDGLSDVILRYY